MNGAELIAAEREKQIAKGYTAEHDEKYPALCMPVFIIPFILRLIDLAAKQGCTEKESAAVEKVKQLTQSAKRKDEVQCLAIIGAFCAAEIDRLQHAESNKQNN